MMLILMIIKIILANKQIPQKQKQQQETNERTKGQSAPKAKLLKAAVLNTCHSYFFEQSRYDTSNCQRLAWAERDKPPGLIW